MSLCSSTVLKFLATKRASPVFDAMAKLRFKTHVVPRLDFFAHKYDIVGDVIPEMILPKALLEMQFPPHTKWLGAYGHNVPPNWTTHSPLIDVSLNDGVEGEGLYSLVLVDADRPNMLTNEYEQWCHWFM